MDREEQIDNLEQAIESLQGKTDESSVAQLKSHRELLEELKK